MAVILKKYYRWVQVKSSELNDESFNQYIEPFHENSWARRDYLNEIPGFKTVEDAENALIKWAEKYGAWETYVLETCHRTETE